jgi:hypothetical protein
MWLVRFSRTANRFRVGVRFPDCPEGVFAFNIFERLSFELEACTVACSSSARGGWRTLLDERNTVR